jgi:hypothetical protein
MPNLPRTKNHLRNLQQNSGGKFGLGRYPTVLERAVQREKFFFIPKM